MNVEASRSNSYPSSDRTNLTGNARVKGDKRTKNAIKDHKLNGNLTQFVPLIYPAINHTADLIDLTICGPELAGVIQTEGPYYLSVNDVAITASPTSGCGKCGVLNEQTNASGQYGFCSLDSTCSKYLLTPVKNDNPLNGVSTYDLVLISKHVLGIQALGSPYKMIAADANKSGSISNIDIIEIRKLILGIYSVFPNNTSWRFVTKDFTFPNSNNPFQTIFDESISCADPTQVKPNDFVAIKVGDVNNNAIGSSKPATRPLTTISWTNTATKSGETIVVPVTYTGAETLEAIQLGLRFDPSRYAFIGTAPGALSGYNAGNFGLTQIGKGEIRTLWFPALNPEERITPGTVLFYLSFKVMKGGSDEAFKLELDDNVLSNAAWQEDGTEFGISGASASERTADEAHSAENALQVKVQPNPSTGAVTMRIKAPQATKARIVLFSGSGIRVLLRDVMLTEGDQLVSLPEVSSLPAGVYSWKVYGAGTSEAGQLIKE